MNVPPPNGPDTKPIGFVITIGEIYQLVQSIDDKIDKNRDETRERFSREITTVREELGKVKNQLAAQWVIHGILVATIVYLVQRGIPQ